MRLQCDPRLATRLGSEKVEAGWRPVWGAEWGRLAGRPVCGARRERLVGATTRLWSEKGEASWLATTISKAFQLKIFVVCPFFFLLWLSICILLALSSCALIDNLNHVSIEILAESIGCLPFCRTLLSCCCP